jgi:hypothetical protein
VVVLEVEPGEVGDDVGLASPLLAVPLPAEAEPEVEFDPDDEDPSDAVSAHATPPPAKIAAPTPRATASPPTRPIYRDESILPPGSGSVASTHDTVARRASVAAAMPTRWEVSHGPFVTGFG